MLSARGKLHGFGRIGSETVEPRRHAPTVDELLGQIFTIHGLHDRVFRVGFVKPVDRIIEARHAAILTRQRWGLGDPID